MIVAYTAWKWYKGTKMVRLEDIPIRKALEEVAQRPETLEPRLQGWRRLLTILWE